MTGVQTCALPICYATTANNATAVLLAYGDEDDIVDRGQSDDFLTALKQARFYARNAVLPGWGHYWMATSPEDPTTGSYQFAPKLLRFLGEKL